MGVFETDYSHGGVDPSQIGLVVTKSDDDGGDATTEIEKALSADQKKSVEAVLAWMGKMAKGPGAPAEEIKAVSSLLGKLAKDGGSQPAKTPTNKNNGGEVVQVTTNKGGETADVMKARHAYELATAKAAGDDATESVEDVTKRHVAELEKAGFPMKPEDEEGKKGKKAKTTKSADGGEGGDEPAGDDTEVANAVVIKADGSVHVSGDAVNVNKAKGFTSARTEALKGAVAGLAKLLGEVDEKQLKEALAGMGDGRFGNLPSNSSVPSSVRPVGTTKSADGGEGEAEGLAEQIAAIVSKAVEPVTKRLDEIESTRNPSKSVEGDGGSDTQTEVKKSLWDGVL